MEQTVEQVLENIRYFISCDDRQKGEQRQLWLNTITEVIKAVEVIKEAEKYRKNNKDYQEKCDDNQTLRVLLSCQAIEMRELRIEAQEKIQQLQQEIATLKAYKKLKEQQLTEDTIEKVFDKHTIIANSDILYRKDLAIDIIKAREEKQTRTCDPGCPFCKTEEAPK